MWRNKNVWIVLIGEFIAGLGLWLGILGNPNLCKICPF